MKATILTVHAGANGEPLTIDMIATTSGAVCSTPDGEQYTFTAAALEKHHSSWVGGILTLNHAVKDNGKITASKYDPITTNVTLTVSVENPATATRVIAKEPTGVSIEANINEWDADNNIIAFSGTGTAIMFYPEQPACPLSQGCGILSKKTYASIIAKRIATHAVKTEDIETVEYDLVTANNNGTLIKIDDIVIWGEKDVKALTRELIYCAARRGVGTYYIYPTAGRQIGDQVIAGSQIKYTIALEVKIDMTGDDKPAASSAAPSLVEVEAKLKESETKLAVQKTEHDKVVAAKDVRITELQKEIDSRDTTVIAKQVAEIKTLDPEADMTGLSGEQITKIHASMQRVAKAKEAAEVSDEVKFAAGGKPVSAKNKLTVGGIVNGKWQDGSGAK